MTKLVHTICYKLRWKGLNQDKGPVSLDEYQKAERKIPKVLHKDASLTEFVALTGKKE